MPETVVHFQLRMPPELHEKLATQAKGNRVSLNALIVRILDQIVEHPEGEPRHRTSMSEPTELRALET
jgi:hypothetical protein